MEKNGEMRRQETTPSSSSEFVLQWGNRKRLRCMKVQRTERRKKKEWAGSDSPVQRSECILTRVDRRVVRSDEINKVDRNTNIISGETTQTSNKKGGNGFISLRQRPSSPPNRILRNCDSSITMKTQSNGIRKLASPERGGDAHDRRPNHLSNGNGNGNGNGSNHQAKNNNINSSRGGKSPSSETGNDGKKGSSPSPSDRIAASWPPKFAIALTNKEKEEDFLVLKGSKLPQRPKKRAKIIQRTVNLISPGAWLCDLSLERYEVREKKVTKKRPRGLKAMGNMVESDSE